MYQIRKVVDIFTRYHLYAQNCVNDDDDDDEADGLIRFTLAIETDSPL